MPELPTGDDIDAMVDGHLQRMEQFLQTGAEVMDAYLSGAAPVLLEQARRPLLGTILQWTDQTELVTSRVLDLDRDLYLRHHTLGRAVSRTDPQLTALAVMPLAMSIEMLAEAGACLLPELVVTGLRDVRAARWLAVGERPTTVQLHARRLDADDDATQRVHVSLAEIDDSGQPSPVIEGIVVLATGLAASAGATAAAAARRRAGALGSGRALQRGDVPPADLAGRRRRRRGRRRRQPAHGCRRCRATGC